MPTYDIRIADTGEEKEIICSYSTLKERIDSGEWIQVHKSTANLVTHVNGTLSKTSGDWKNLLGTIKKGSGRGNTIKT